MKTFLRLHAARGFSLVELMIAMGISTLLMAALASIFATSVNTREKIDREGQKIETARYSLDTLAEDIRLAGYYGTLAPALPPLAGVTATIVNGATPVDWKYVDPCSTANGDLPGWSTATVQNADSGTVSVDVPMPIFGYEMHGATDLPPTALLGCIGAYDGTTTLSGAPVAGPPPSGGAYQRGTDVFVIRRVSTVAVTVGGAGYASGDPYLQTSTCPPGGLDAAAKYPPRFLAKATTTSGDFNLHLSDCATIASVRKLITRIYFISQCDDCFNDLDNNPATMGDGIPTLKMVELGMSGGALSVIKNVRTIAPGVENMHLEYGIDTTGDGSVDAWVVSNNNPRQGAGSATGTLVTGMRCDNPIACASGSENRWEDVMAVKLFLITRDLKTTSGPAFTKSFTMGSLPALTTPADGYRRRMTSSTIKLVNMSGRREAP